MKKYIIATLLVCTGWLAITSCDESFLDEQIYSSLAPETLSDSLGFEAAVTGLHRHFSSFHTYADQQGWLSVWQVGTDIVWAVQPQGIEVPFFRYEQLSSTSGAASFSWTWAYTLIKNANAIIASAEDPAIGGMTQANKDAINAEARFFRAYAYNFLVTIFGGVPLVTEPITAPKTDFVRASVDDINAVIEADLLFAAANLPDIDNVKKKSGKPMFGRANKAMAQQLLAEAYLRMGRPAEAEAQCMAIISSGKFNLRTTRYGVRASQPGDAFSDMFIMGNMRRGQGNTEAIWVFEIENPTDLPGAIGGNPQQRRVWGAGYHGVTGGGMLPADSLGGRGISRMRLNNFVLYGLYPAGDMRNSKYNIRRKFWYNDPNNAKYRQPVVPVAADTLFRIHPYTLKWGQFDSRDAFGFGMWKDLMLMRLGETYLLLAEAQFKQGKPGDAANSINMLRTRANAPQVTAGDITLDFILDERVRELIGEENRRMTLVRTGTLLDRVASRNATAPNAATMITGLTSTHLLFPIPQSEIDLNKDAELEQNTGY
ncbi:MAG TPA: RagB/SusD family nutrient uptake outer membrane protein [Chryseosolibacter sp.]|nr:RagB/SusD family nutrient uptake outer membrane protein [Chryseosolibacter sp.]